MNEIDAQAMLNAAINQRNGALNENLQLVGMLAAKDKWIAELEKRLGMTAEGSDAPAA